MSASHEGQAIAEADKLVAVIGAGISGIAA
jgi:NAD-dependent SIR2 family protein deacetylase